MPQIKDFRAKKDKSAGRGRLRRAVSSGVMAAAALAVFGTAAFYYIGDAHALRVTMKRVVFEGPVRAEVLTIINNTGDEQVYRLGWKKMVMSEEQSLRDAEEGDDIATGHEEIREMVRYAPRRIVLPPGASQQVRLMLRRPRDLADGEYRSHFWIQPEAESVRFDTSNVQAPEGGAAVQIRMLTGLTLPVFVRQGDLTASAQISDARLTQAADGSPAVQYTIHREGTRSLYGDVEVLCTANDGSEVVASMVRGIAVYLEVDKRRVTNRLTAMPEQGCRAMNVRYRSDREDQHFKGELLAEAPVAM